MRNIYCCKDSPGHVKCTLSCVQKGKFTLKMSVMTLGPSDVLVFNPLNVNWIEHCLSIDYVSQKRIVNIKLRKLLSVADPGMCSFS